MLWIRIRSDSDFIALADPDVKKLADTVPV
jgi:hypothetical protein